MEENISDFLDKKKILEYILNKQYIFRLLIRI